MFEQQQLFTQMMQQQFSMMQQQQQQQLQNQGKGEGKDESGEPSAKKQKTDKDDSSNESNVNNVNSVEAQQQAALQAQQQLNMLMFANGGAAGGSNPLALLHMMGVPMIPLPGPNQAMVQQMMMNGQFPMPPIIPVAPASGVVADVGASAQTQKKTKVDSSAKSSFSSGENDNSNNLKRK